MVSTNGKSNGHNRQTGGGKLQAEGFAPGSDGPSEEVSNFQMPTAEEQVQECQAMNLITLREVFASRKSLKKKEARAAGLVFRAVSGQMRTLEYGQED